MVLEIAASTVKNTHFSLFPRNDERVEFCGGPSVANPGFRAASQWITEDEALKKRMQSKVVEFIDKGSDIYQ